MANRLPSAARRVALSVVMAGVVVIVSSAALGLLYYLRQPTASWPGPKVRDALPLGELAGHASVSLVVFVAVLGLGAVAVALCSRVLGFDGLAISLSVGAGVGLWYFLTSAISIYIVRQVSLSAAFVAAREITAIYLAAVLFGAAVASSSTHPHPGRRLTRLVPSLVGLLGAIDVLAGSLPNRIEHFGLLGDVFVGPASPTARTIEVTTGILLLICVAGLGRRSKRALWFAVALSVVSLLTRVVAGFSIAATIICVLVVLLALASRSDFRFEGDPASNGVALLRLGALVVGALAYSLLTLFINRTAADLPFYLSAAFRATWRSLVLGSPGGDADLSGDFGAWFPWSLRAFVALGLIWAAGTWFAPWRHRFPEELSRRSRAERVVALWGSDSLAPFTLRADKAHYFYPDAQADPDKTTLIAYRVVRGVAIVSGDPIGPVEQVGEAFHAFLASAAERGWRVAVVGASERYLEVYRGLGLHVLYHGDEAILDTGGFSLQGGARKSVRQATHRLARKGYRAETMLAGDLALEVRGELSALEEDWLRGAPRKGFVMELDDLFRLDGDDAVFVVGRDEDGRLVGFLELAVCPPSRSLSLSTMPRGTDAPNGLNAFLIVHAVEWAAAHEFYSLSLNFAPGARLMGRDLRLSGLQRVARVGLRVAKRLFGLQLDDLLSFNNRFAPRWQPRYIVYQHHRQLLRVATAAMAAERYLPFTDFLRGRDWAPASSGVSAVPAARSS